MKPNDARPLFLLAALALAVGGCAPADRLVGVPTGAFNPVYTNLSQANDPATASGGGGSNGPLYLTVTTNGASVSFAGIPTINSNLPMSFFASGGSGAYAWTINGAAVAGYTNASLTTNFALGSNWASVANGAYGLTNAFLINHDSLVRGTYGCALNLGVPEIRYSKKVFSGNTTWNTTCTMATLETNDGTGPNGSGYMTYTFTSSGGSGQIYLLSTNITDVDLSGYSDLLVTFRIGTNSTPSLNFVDASNATVNVNLNTNAFLSNSYGTNVWVTSVIPLSSPIFSNFQKSAMRQLRIYQWIGGVASTAVFACERLVFRK